MADNKVLIIDDEPGIVSLCSRLLTRATYEVEGVSDPAEGLGLMEAADYDLLLVDIRMPGMDGFEVIENARHLQPEIAVVIMTGFGTLETAIQALRHGADGLILKPFEKGADLVRTVNDSLLARRDKQEVARLRAIRPLLTLTEKLFSETRLEELHGLILVAIREQLASRHAMIYHREPGASKIILVEAAGKSFSEEHARASGGLLGRAVHWDVPVWLNLDGPGETALKETLISLNFSGAVCIPVKRGSGSFVFAAARDIGQPGFTLADVETFGLLARQADIALENARLYEDLRAYIRQIEQSQRALIQAEKMSAVGRLTASIAHEVNNPLQAVQNCLHLGQRTELSDEKRQEYLEMAREELDRLMSTVQRMLDFYRPGVLERKPTDLGSLVDKVIALLDKQLSTQEIEVEKVVEGHVPHVSVVANQIQQVFFNLVLNAMEAIGKEGKITISLRQAAGQVQVDFRDTGPGVDPAVTETIFEPFVSTGENGTGLGLSVSYGILTAHNGSLELLDDGGGGAAFRVTVPTEDER